MSRAGFEAIMFQVNNPLGRDISNAIAKAFQYRNDLDYSNVPEKERINYKHREMLRYCLNTLFPELKKIISKESGLIVKDIFYTKDLSFTYAVIFQSLDDTLRTYIGDRSSGIASGAVLPKYITDIEKQANDLSRQLSPSIDLKTSKIDYTKYKFVIDIVFDYLSVFCLNDYIPQTVAKELSPDEVTAFLLHEVGHAFEFIEHSSDMYLKVNNIQEKFRILNSGISNTNDYKELSNVAKNNIFPIAKEIQGTPELLTKAVYKVGDKLEELSSVNTKYMSLFGSALRSLLVIILRILSVIIGVFQVYRLMSFVISLFSIPLARVSGNYNISGNKKLSDVSDSAFGIKMIESRADEFTSRHGYGSYLASGLTKIRDAKEYMEVSSVSNLFNNHIYVIKYCQVLIGLTQILNLTSKNTNALIEYTFNFPDLQKLSYDRDIDRIKRIMTSSRSIFKDNLTPDQLTRWIPEYERLQTALDDAKLKSRNSRLTKFIEKMYEFILISPTNYEEESRKYDTFLTQVNELINNEMYFNSAKFGQLANLK